MKFKFIFSMLMALFFLAACQKDEAPITEFFEDPLTVNYDGDSERVWHWADDGTLRVSAVGDPADGFSEIYAWEKISEDVYRLQLTGMEYQDHYTPDPVECCWYRLELTPLPDDTMRGILKPESGQEWTYLTFKKG